MEIVGCLRRELVEEEEEEAGEEEGRPKISTTCLSIITQAKRQFLWSIIRVEHTHTPYTHTHTQLPHPGNHCNALLVYNKIEYERAMLLNGKLLPQHVAAAAAR